MREKERIRELVEVVQRAHLRREPSQFMQECRAG